LGWALWRCGGKSRDRQLSDRVKQLQAPVVGHMLLRLRRHDLGQGKIGGLVGQGSSPSMWLWETLCRAWQAGTVGNRFY
jgi:hypothetical protein